MTTPSVSCVAVSTSNHEAKPKFPGPKFLDLKSLEPCERNPPFAEVASTQFMNSGVDFIITVIKQLLPYREHFAALDMRFYKDSFKDSVVTDEGLEELLTEIWNLNIRVIHVSYWLGDKGANVPRSFKVLENLGRLKGGEVEFQHRFNDPKWPWGVSSLWICRPILHGACNSVCSLLNASTHLECGK